MDRNELLTRFWADVAAQNAVGLKDYFAPHAYIRWNNTNEQFTVEEYIVANCEYPGSWWGEVQRIEQLGDLAVTVARVCSPEEGLAFHVTSFFEFEGQKIAVLNEYWGDDGPAPQWRLDKKIGKPIQ